MHLDVFLSSFISQPLFLWIAVEGFMHDTVNPSFRHPVKHSDKACHIHKCQTFLKLCCIFFCRTAAGMCFNGNLHRNLHIPVVVLKLMPGMIAAMQMTDRCYSIHTLYPLTQLLITMFMSLKYASVMNRMWMFVSGSVNWHLAQKMTITYLDAYDSLWPCLKVFDFLVYLGDFNQIPRRKPHIIPVITIVNWRMSLLT